MSAETKVYPSSIVLRNLYYGIVVPYLNINATRLEISPANVTSLNRLYNNPLVPPATEQPLSEMGWLQLFPLYADKAGSRLTTVKNETFLRDYQLQHLLSSIYNDIPKSKWTVEDRLATGRKGPAHGHRTRSTDIEKATAASASLEPGGKNQLVLHITQAGGQPGATRKREGKEKNIKEYLFHYSVYTPLVPASGTTPASGTADPTGIEQCTVHKIITRTPYRMNFPPAQASMRCGGYVETIEKPNKEGPISPFFFAIIPG